MAGHYQPHGRLVKIISRGHMAQVEGAASAAPYQLGGQEEVKGGTAVRAEARPTCDAQRASETPAID
jgi:hypothetical protein